MTDKSIRIDCVPVIYNGTSFRSTTEARWAVFFDYLGIDYEYEKEQVSLETGGVYIPDFYLPQLEMYIEVKPNNLSIIENEYQKPIQMRKQVDSNMIFIGLGIPRIDDNYLYRIELDDNPLTDTYRYYSFYEDRRDDGIFWLGSEDENGSPYHFFDVGGWGSPTDHDRYPIKSKSLIAAINKSTNATFEDRAA